MKMADLAAEFEVLAGTMGDLAEKLPEGKQRDQWLKKATSTAKAARRLASHEERQAASLDRALKALEKVNARVEKYS